MSVRDRTRCLIYVRQSDSRGVGTDSVSIHSQEHLLRGHAKRHGWIVVGVEVDADLRGGDDDRPGFRSCMTRAAAGEYDTLLFYDMSRFARGLWLQEPQIRDLERHGVAIHSYMEPHASDPLYRQILGAVAEQYTRTLRAHSRRAVEEKVRRGIHPNTPYGYARPDKRSPLAVDEDRPERADAVRRMFRWRAAGVGTTEIRMRLVDAGLPSPTGVTWSTKTVRTILQNTVYVGTAYANDATCENAHPAIVDADLFDAVQATFGESAAGRGMRWRKVRSSWLERYVYHDCGERMYLVARNGGTTAPAFVCGWVGKSGNYPPENRCTLPKKSRRADWLEDEAWSLVVDAVAAMVDPDDAVRRAEERARTLRPESAARRADAERRLRALDARFARAESLYLDGERNRDWLNAQEARIAAERVAVQRELDALPPEPDGDVLRTAAAVLRSLRDSLSEMPDEYRTSIIARLGVVFYGEHGARLVVWPDIAPLLPDLAPLTPDMFVNPDQPRRFRMCVDGQ